MTVALHEAGPDDLPVVRNLVGYYIYDMSEHLGWPCRADGTFGGCDRLESHWTHPRRHAFVFRDGEELAGFALVRSDHEEPDIDHSVAEFFVLRKFRGQGVGGRMARRLFDRFPGRWQVTQLEPNAPAVSFWRRIIGRYADFSETTAPSPWGPQNVIAFSNAHSPTERAAT